MRAVLKRGDDDAVLGGTDVRDWQTLLKVTPADGKFGAVTENATRAFQQAKGLVSDGIAGPITQNTARGVPVPTKANPADANAYAIARKAAPTMPEPHLHYALAVARGEGFYGLGWKGEGAGSNNWGAVQGKGSAGSFQTTDHHADGTAYTGTFKRYLTPEEGFLDMARILFGGGKRGAAGAAELKDALARGSIEDAAKAQRANGYFELAADKYAQAVTRNYAALTGSGVLRKVLGAAAGSLGGAGGAGLAVVGGLIVGGLLWWARSKG